MHDFRFHSPEYLLLLLALPFLYLFLQWLESKSKNTLLRFVSAENMNMLIRSGRAQYSKKIALWIGLSLLVVALARPQANPSLEERDQASLDVLVLLDVSKSMDAEDVPPSRLKKAKKTISRMLDQLSGDRVGILAFASSAALITPLTSDYDLIKTYLENVDTSLIEGQGTDIGSALELAHSAMNRGAETKGTQERRSNVYIVLSDGEDHEKSNFNIAKTIQENGGIIFTIAYGTERGVPIPVRDNRGELRGYKRDTSGSPVLTKVQPKSLQELAATGGGQFYFSTSDDAEIGDILKRTTDLDRKSAAVIKAKIYQEYFYPLLLAGFILLCVSYLHFRGVLSIRPLQLPKWRKNKAAVILLPFVFLLSDSAPALANPLSFFWDKEKKESTEGLNLAKEGKFTDAVDHLKELQAENPDSPEVNYNIGTLLLNAKKGKEGREQLERIVRQKGPLQHQARFNIAGSFAQEGKNNEAKMTYADLISSLAEKESLSGLSEDEQKLLHDAKLNLARLSTSEQQQKQQQQKDQQEQEKNPQNGSGENKQQNSSENQENQKQDPKDDNSKKDKDNEKKDEKEKKENESDQSKQDQQKKDPEQNSKQDQDENKGQDKDEQKPDQDEQKEENKQESSGKNQQQKYGSRPFKERDNMGEEEAKQILEALKQQEKGLQKRFLKKKEGNSKLNGDGKDW